MRVSFNNSDGDTNSDGGGAPAGGEPWKAGAAELGALNAVPGPGGRGGSAARGPGAVAIPWATGAAQPGVLNAVLGSGVLVGGTAQESGAGAAS